MTGIPSGSYRLVPDISLDSSPNNAGYLYCSSDPSTDITGSCSHGFRDSNDEYLTVAGGTSFAAPIFAGMLAIINQKLDSSGQGVINSTLYTHGRKLDHLCLGLSRHHQRQQRMHRRVKLLLIGRRVGVSGHHRV